MVLIGEKKKGIDVYMLTPEFADLMRDHYAQRCLQVFKQGWDATVEAILEARPEVFEADSFHYPLTVHLAENSEESEEEQVQDGDRVVTDPTSNSTENPVGARGQKRKSMISSSGSETDTRFLEGTSSSSSESDEKFVQKKKKTIEASSETTSDSEPSKAS